ncbi:MAG: hypothetical protein IT439_05660 [Phycisphaerales bacterium]|nr:hypothetical protein [Phycisphaerales bacterium]
MPSCVADPSIERRNEGSFAFPLGVYPIEPLTPRPGYIMAFEPADGGDESDDVEEWPDRYVFEAVITATRVPALMRAILMMAPARVYPILDVLGYDAYREIDPYIGYDLVGVDRIWEAMRTFGPLFFDDGLCGFGLTCDDPFFYAFLDEHKILTLRVPPEMKDRVERVLRAFDLEPCEDPQGADAAAHEHRSVLLVSDKPGIASFEEIVEHLRDDWRLALNLDPDSNLDEEGNPLGVTPWRCLIRITEEQPRRVRYAELVLWAASLSQAEETATNTIQKDETFREEHTIDMLVVNSDRLDEERALGLREPFTLPRKAGTPGHVMRVRWLD